MTKQELIDRITLINRDATPEFLAELSERDLTDYVRQLNSLGVLPAEHKTPYEDSTVEA